MQSKDNIEHTSDGDIDAIFPNVTLSNALTVLWNSCCLWFFQMIVVFHLDTMFIEARVRVCVCVRAFTVFWICVHVLDSRERLSKMRLWHGTVIEMATRCDQRPVNLVKNNNNTQTAPANSWLWVRAAPFNGAQWLRSSEFSGTLKPSIRNRIRYTGS